MQTKIKLIALGAAVAFTALVFIGTIGASNSFLAWVATLSRGELILLQASYLVVPLVAVLAGVAWRRRRVPARNADMCAIEQSPGRHPVNVMETRPEK